MFRILVLLLPLMVLAQSPEHSGTAGMFQLNIRIPFDSWTGDHVPVNAGFRDTPAGYSQTIAIRE
jgi:hypothetical protein